MAIIRIRGTPLDPKTSSLDQHCSRETHARLLVISELLDANHLPFNAEHRPGWGLSAKHEYSLCSFHWLLIAKSMPWLNYVMIGTFKQQQVDPIQQDFLY